MKYLFTFAAVGSPVDQRIIAAAEGRSGNTDESAFLRNVEELIVTSLNEVPDAIAFYRSVMDGWDATHRGLAEWISSCRPGAEKTWQEFCDSGLLVWQPTRSASLGLDACPGIQEMTRITRGVEVEAYAIRAFLYALYDAMEFAVAAETTLVAVGRCMGVTRDDSEYGQTARP